MNPTRTLKRLLPMAAAALLSVSACAGGKDANMRPGDARAATIAAPVKMDADGDTDSAHPDEDDLTTPPVSDGDNASDARPGAANRPRDSDDGPVVDFGHPASAGENATIAALVRRYYATAVAEDGAKACSMLYSTFAEAIPEDYGSPSGPPWARGTTCAGVMTAIFKHNHDALAYREQRLHVVQVRVSGRHGLALLRFPGLIERELGVEREEGTWRIFGLTDRPLP